MSDHHHYEYASDRHDHRGEYAEARHDHFGEYAQERHRHYDLETDDKTAQQAITCLRAEVAELRRQLDDALDRIGDLEKQTPQARRLHYEADLEEAEAWSGRGPSGSYEEWLAEGESEPSEDLGPKPYDPGPEIDDEGGMSEHRYYVMPEDYQRGQS